MLIEERHEEAMQLHSSYGENVDEESPAAEDFHEKGQKNARVLAGKKKE